MAALISPDPVSTDPVSADPVMPESGAIEIRALAPADAAVWRDLYRAYAAFYAVPMTDDILGRTWGWLHDTAHPLSGLVAVSGGRVVGFAHYWPQPRPLLGRDAGFLDDLFVDPSVRGQGVGRRLIAALADIGRAQGWPLLSWVTAQDNATARRLYDDVAQAARWVTYEKPL